MTAKRKKTERDVLLALALSPIEQRIYKEVDGNTCLTDIAMLAGIEPKTATTYFLRLAQKGLIRRVERGIYARRYDFFELN